jgi:hypothetical protein
MTRLEMIAAALDYANNYPDNPDDETREAIFWQHYAWLFNESIKR